MEQVKAMIKGAVITLTFCAIVTLTLLVLSEWQTVRAEAIQPVVIKLSQEATSSLPQRDITIQHFAPARP